MDSQPQPITPPETPKTNILVWLVGGVIILGVGIGIGLFFGKQLYSQNTAQINSYDQCVTAKGSSIQESYPGTCVTTDGRSFVQPLTDEEKNKLLTDPAAITNWRTYTNSTFGFSLQYPPAWKITTDLKPEGAQFINEKPVVLIHDDQLRSDPDVGPNSTYPSHYVGISTLASSKTLQEFLNSVVLVFSPEVQKDTREFMNQKALTINRTPAVSFVEPGMGGRGRLIAVSNGRHIVLFSFPYQLGYEKDDNFTQDKYYTQILSTFKFVDRLSSVSKWQGYDYLENEVYTTNNWLDFQGKKGNIHYIFNFPWNWEKTNSVFLDENGAKVAELSPGGVETKPGQICFDKSDVSATESRVKIISTTPITINSLTGVLQVQEVQYEGGGGGKYTGIWYPNVYCLQKGDKAFVMTFYETSLNSGKQSLFEEILATFDFVN